MTHTQQTMGDILVVLPGILGSVLSKDGKDLWGLSGQAISKTLLSFGGNLHALKLAAGIGDDDPQDGIVATRLLNTLHLLPGFWKIDGYDGLVNFLSHRFALRQPTKEEPGNFIVFPYDWRLSNILSARRLASKVIPELERWQRETNNPAAKLIFICHSMGGLVARYFLEVLGGKEVTRKLISIGTPYRGAAKALAPLVNGFSVKLGPIRTNFDELVRSMPSVYQLLPTYPCVATGDGNLQTLDAVSLPNIAQVDIQHGNGFHARIAEKVEERSPYKTYAIKGISQPTVQSAILQSDAIVPLQSYKGLNLGGDGTVPRPSSHPPELETDDDTVMAAQSHSSLQATDSVLSQIFAILTSDRLGRFMTVPSIIGAEMPDMIIAGEALGIKVIAEDGDETLPLQVQCDSEYGEPFGRSTLLRSDGKGGYSATVENLLPGAYRVTISSASPLRPVEKVTDLVLVWDTALGEVFA